MSSKYIINNILDVRPNKSVSMFFDRIEKYRKIDRGHLQTLAVQLVRCHSGNKSYEQYKDNNLERQWYSSLEEGEPDYSVYDKSIYISDLWSCWICYSRKYLREVRNHKSLLHQKVGEIKRIVDVGCGFGYTTAALAQLYPDAEVFGTNLEGTTQFEVASDMSREYGFKVVSDASKIDGDADLVFASEYFEHFLAPVEHLHEVLDQTNTKCLIVANSFGTISVGHFIHYEVNGEKVAGKSTAKLFNKTLRNRGYEPLETSMWNNKPSVWEKSKGS